MTSPETNGRAKLIDKIRKLLALSESPNEHEAARAAERAQAMLAEYNLSMSDVATKETDDNFIIDGELKGGSYPWKRQLAAMVAKMYFCTYFFTQEKLLRGEPLIDKRARYDVHHFVGAAHNVAVVKLMFKYLADTIDRLAQEAADKVPAAGRETYRSSFLWGCGMRVCRRIQDRINATRVPTRASDGSTLPALADLYDQTAAQLKAWVNQELGELRSSSRGRVTDARAMSDGKAAGDRVGLDTQVGSSRSSAPALTGARHLLK